MTDVGDVAGAVKSISDLVDGILTRADRDEPDKEHDDNITRIQNGFATANLDDQYVLSYKLLVNAGLAPTPSRDVGESERSFRHEFMIAVANLIYERKLAIRALSKLTSQ